MNRELQDKAWSVLPQEFKEEVKALYTKARDIYNIYTSATCINGNESRIIDVFFGEIQVIDALFGSKCLSDESARKEPKPAEQEKEDIKLVKNPDNRLMIAAMAMQELLTRIDDTPKVIAEAAFRYADAIIAESEKGGKNHD